MRHVPPAHTPLPPAALLRLAAPPPGSLAALGAVLSDRHGSPQVELLGSGTQALTRALSAFGGPGATVALPGWGCYDLASAAVGAGVAVRLYDLDPATLQPDADSLAGVAPEVDAVVVVSFFGIPVEPGRLPAPLRGGDGGGPALIHDAAQAHGARFGPGSVESLADVTILSFGRGKGWTGLAGGALVIRSARAREALDAGSGPIPAGSGMDRLGRGVRGLAQWLLGRPSLYGLPARIPALGLGETRYHAPRPPEALDEAAAAILLASRRAADGEARLRRERGEELRAAAEAGGAVQPVRVSEGVDPGFLRLPVLDTSGVDRPGAARLGILPGYPLPLARLDPLKPLLRGADPLPGSARLAERLLTLPTHSRTSARDRSRLRAWLAAASPPSRP